jgi:NAD(P)-dependent dehydrogenase (short-subunit alcohol dehydrogenase family)
VAFDQGGAGKALAARLAGLGVEVLAVEGAPDAADLECRLRGWMTEGAIQGIYWLPALDREGEIASLATWREALRVRAKLLYTTLRTLYGQIGGPGTFLVSATRLGGRHGYDEAGSLAPLGGTVTGMTKSFQRERPDALVKAVDFAGSAQAEEIAGALLEETLRDPGAVEVGREAGRRSAVGLVERITEAGGPGMKLGRDTVFVVTGAAGSIVSAIVADLAAASGGAFHLLDLTPEPDPADPDIALFTSDKEALKRSLFERLQAGSERATPARIEKELARVERAQAALAAIQAVRAAGGEARWHQLDLRDGEAAARAIGEVRRTHGRVDVLLHAAGLEISRLLPDKKAEEFDLVFDVKADGWFNLVSAIGDMPLGAAVAFSSIAGRFGNGGQADYSSANDLLCKAVSGLRRTRPETFGIAIDWTAWGGLGMATRGSIPKVMEAAGIDMLPPEIGIPVIRRELTAGARGEIVVAGRLGVMLQERDKDGGLDLTAVRNRGLMTGRVSGLSLYDGLTVETLLDPSQPFLDDHRIDGTPVLPGVMGIEAFAEAAGLLFPDLRVAAVEDVEFLAPFKLYRDEPRTIEVRVLPRLDGEAVIADCELLGRRTLPGQAEPQVTVHFRGRVRLAPEETLTPNPSPAPSAHPRRERGVPTLPFSISPLSQGGRAGGVGEGGQGGEGSGVGAEDVYRIYFHGPAYQVLASAWRDGEGVAGKMAAGLPPGHLPAELPAVMEPRLIELCFQTAGIGELGDRGRMALPFRVGSVATLRHPAPGTPLYAVTRPGNEEGVVDAYVVDGNGNVCVTVSGYRTIELPGGVDPGKLIALREALLEPVGVA